MRSGTMTTVGSLGLIVVAAVVLVAACSAQASGPPAATLVALTTPTLTASTAPIATPAPTSPGAGVPSHATPEPAPTRTAEAPAPASSTPRPSDRSACVNILVIEDGLSYTTRNLASVSSPIVVGTFVGFDPARWTTGDGKRPERYQHGDSIGGAFVYQPAHMDTQTVLRGQLDPGPFLARVNGGQAGCDLFLQVSPNAGNDAPDVRLMHAWPIDAEDIVTTAIEGGRPLAEVIREIRDTEPFEPPGQP